MTGRSMLAVVVFLGAAGEQVRGPAIVRVGTEYELVLPEAMATAIQEAVPGFQPETMSSYDSDIQELYDCTSRQTPWAVVGDFDGDGLQDVIVDGHAGEPCYRLCAWGASAHVDTIFGKVGDRRRGGRPFHSVLMYAWPGEQRSGCSDSTVFIFCDGYVDDIFERAASTWYWQDGKWHGFVSSD
jgi:hypothetical protein